MRSLLTLALVVAPTFALAAEKIPGPVEATVVRVIDGDTVAVNARTWLDTTVETRIRLEGVDTPEKGARAKCKAEAALGAQADKLTREMLPPGAKVRLSQIEQDKYGGRAVARIADAKGRDVSAALIKAKLAKPYDGGRKASWCK